MQPVAHSLSPFMHDVECTRDMFCEGFHGMPAELRGTIKQYVHDRIARAAPNPLLGEYLPWMFAELFDVSDTSVTMAVSMQWLNVYFFTLMIDDAIDNSERYNTPHHLIASSLLLQRGLLSPSGKGIPSEISRLVSDAFDTTAKAACGEVARRRNSNSYSDSDVNALGEKLAIGNVCVGLFRSNGAVRPGSSWVTALYSSFATGIQMLDDITDIQEDWRTGNYTFLIERARQCQLPEVNSSDDEDCRTFHSLLHRLVRSGALEYGFRMARSRFVESLTQLSSQSGDSCPNTAQFLSSLISGCDSSLCAVQLAEARIGSRDVLKNDDIVVLESLHYKLQEFAQGS